MDIQDPMDKLGLLRHATKGGWGKGATKLDHLGFTVNTEKIKSFFTEKKRMRMRSMEARLLDQARMGNGYVSVDLLTYFCGRTVSLTLALPLARFYTRSLYAALKNASRIQGESKLRLSGTHKKDLKFRGRLGFEGRFIL